MHWQELDVLAACMLRLIEQCSAALHSTGCLHRRTTGQVQPCQRSQGSHLLELLSQVAIAFRKQGQLPELTHCTPQHPV